MSGLFPGLWVMVNQRRKINKQCRKVSLCRRCESPLMVTDRRQPLVTRISDLDANALRARKRLEQKLGYLQPYSRSGVLPQNMRSGRNLKAGMKCTCLGSKLFGSRWPLKLRRCRSCRKICSVCLEGFQDKQQIAKLSCSHKFHLDCVLPWLAAHPHCPYCRTPVLVS
ncbi:hypothetical protein WN943_028874 [Citrus x changshan-huyou]|uniref:RING-type domain-containing protein n=1 Tax=Citrus sinensis TaxID=2711 RepID=A0A067G4E2_CITSI|nr:hypothetical protein CISIN_1g044515mg [Citrus sinensis]